MSRKITQIGEYPAEFERRLKSQEWDYQIAQKVTEQHRKQLTKRTRFLSIAAMLVLTVAFIPAALKDQAVTTFSDAGALQEIFPADLGDEIPHDNTRLDEILDEFLLARF